MTSDLKETFDWLFGDSAKEAEGLQRAMKAAEEPDPRLVARLDALERRLLALEARQREDDEK